MRRSLLRNLRAGAKGLLTGLPMVVARDEMGEMFRLLQRLVGEQRFDVVHADQLSMAGYAMTAAGKPQSPSALLDEHNAVYMLTRRMAEGERNRLKRGVMWREARAFARYEREMMRAFDAVLAVTEEDRQHLLALLPEAEREGLAARMTVAPICVDPEREAPVARAEGGPPTILHLGTMFWPPNVEGVLWFASEVLPRVRKVVPQARFAIVGKNPPQEVVALGKADPLIEVTGYVADPTPYLAAADAFIVPLHAGGGMRVKILDAWMRGLPVVSTAIGAEGIEVRDGENILLTSTTDDAEREAFAFAVATIRLLTEPGLNQALRRNGRAWVEARYSWQAVYERIDAVYDRLMHKREGWSRE